MSSTPARPAIIHARANGSAIGGNSDAALTLNAIDILTATAGQSVEDSWRWLQQKLTACGYQTTGMLISDNDFTDPLEQRGNQLYGKLMSDDYMEYSIKNRQEFRQTKAYKTIQRSNKPLTYLSDEDFRHHTPTEEKLARFVHNRFNVKAWALFPVHAIDRKRMYTFGWWDLTDQREARKLWNATAANMMLATTYFCEAIAPTVDADFPVNPARLSAREKECLLWVGAGKTTGEISAILSISEGTVNEFIKRASKKLGATNRTQACVKAILQGIIEP